MGKHQKQASWEEPYVSLLAPAAIKFFRSGYLFITATASVPKL